MKPRNKRTTEEKFYDGLVKLMKRKEYKNITITDVAAEAGLSRMTFYRHFDNVDDVTGDIDGKKEDYFGYLFAMGAGIKRETSQAARAAIRQGRVIVGMTEDEVRLALGEPDNTALGENGRFDWIYKRTSKLLIVQFDGRTGKVINYKTSSGTTTSKKK